MLDVVFAELNFPSYLKALLLSYLFEFFVERFGVFIRNLGFLRSLSDVLLSINNVVEESESLVLVYALVLSYHGRFKINYYN